MYFLYLCSCAGEESFYSSVRVMNFDHEHVIYVCKRKIMFHTSLLRLLQDEVYQ